MVIERHCPKIVPGWCGYCVFERFYARIKQAAEEKVVLESCHE